MGDPAAAISPLQECADVCAERGERWNRSYALWGLGLAAWLLGDAERAGELERAALRIKREVADQVGAAHCIEALAWIAASRRRPAHAALLLGAAAAAREAVPATLPPPWDRTTRPPTQRSARRWARMLSPPGWQRATR